MTIDEAIAHAREVATIQRNNDKLNKTLGVISPYYKTDCIKCAEEHEQLAEWLEELKEYKYNEYVICEKYNVSSIDDVYNKVIDDLSEKLCCAFSENSTKGECEGFTCDILTLDSVSDLVISVSEQLRQQN